MVALDLLRSAFARGVDFGGEVPFVGTPGICIGAPDTKGLEQGLQFHKDLVCAPTKDVRQHVPAAVIEGVPQPPWLLLFAHESPHFVHFGLVHAVQDDLDVTRVEILE